MVNGFKKNVLLFHKEKCIIDMVTLSIRRRLFNILRKESRMSLVFVTLQIRIKGFALSIYLTSCAFCVVLNSRGW